MQLFNRMAKVKSELILINLIMFMYVKVYYVF
jgi:hypothetical protein